MTDGTEPFWRKLKTRVDRAQLADAERRMAGAEDATLPEDRIAQMMAAALGEPPGRVIEMPRRRWGWAAALLVVPVLVVALFRFDDLFDVAPSDSQIETRTEPYPAAMHDLLAPRYDVLGRRNAIGRVAKFVEVSIATVTAQKTQGGAVSDRAEEVLSSWRAALEYGSGGSTGIPEPIMHLLEALRAPETPQERRLELLPALEDEIVKGIAALRRSPPEAREVENVRQDFLDLLERMLMQ